MATAVYYVEDPDSLRFALSVVESYDVAALQPHFPGYPVFWAAAELCYVVTGSFAVAFALVGGLSTYVLVCYALRWRGLALRSVEGAALAALLFFNPLGWLMGTRYMPDLMGAALALAAFVYLSEALYSGEQHRGTTHTGEHPQSPGGDRPLEGVVRSFMGWHRRSHPSLEGGAPQGRRVLNGAADLPTRDTMHRIPAGVLGLLLAGFLAGLRLSYVPFVLIPALWVLARPGRRGWKLAAGAAGVLAWLVPLVVDTGWHELVAAAQRQTEGHFTEFGGTVLTESSWGRRLAGFVSALWADALGAWWPGRHPLTLLVGLGAVVAVGAAAWRLARERPAWRPLALMVACCVVYAVWVLLYQNVVYKSRHVLPLVPPLLMMLAYGAAPLLRSRAWAPRLVMLACGACYAAVTLVLVAQHRQPTAVAEAKRYVEEIAAGAPGEALTVVSIPLVHFYLEAQGVEAYFLSVNDPRDRVRLERPSHRRTVVVGTYPGLFDEPPDRDTTFYHNPYVNRMWPEVRVAVYGEGRMSERARRHSRPFVHSRLRGDQSPVVSHQEP